jgi:hypothetical protein
MNNAQKIAAGQQAETERGQIKEAVEHVKAALLEKIGSSEPNEVDEREQYYYEYRALDSVMNRLQSVIDSGKVAAKYLNEG